MSSKRSQRRKLKEELDTIAYINGYSSDNQHKPIKKIHIQPLVQSELLEYSPNFLLQPIQSHQTTQSSNLINDPNSVNSPITPVNHNIELFNLPKLPCVSFKEELALWTTSFKIPKTASDALLKILKNHDCFQDLPSDSRTLLGTNLSCLNLRKVNPGIYYHFGLAKGIKYFAPREANEIKIVIGIDGLPLTKSSNSQFWPILAYIRPNSKHVFIVGLYHGMEKPKDSDDYLKDLINESQNLIANGIHIFGKTIPVFIDSIICDAPAKSFILKVKGHGGFESCTRCVIEGEYLNNRVCFPYNTNLSLKRTHTNYKNMTYDGHHISSDISKLSDVPRLDMVLSFPLDYLHLVCLGGVKKMIQLWLHKGPVNVRLHSRQILKLSKRLLYIKNQIPCDFSRKPRAIQDVGRWKGTEFRQFLIYTGPVILKNILSEDCYNNFMALNISMVILLSPNYGEYINYAHTLLDYFVKSFGQLYGKHFISHNIHGMLHLADDYERYGILDNCSSFPFENFMKNLKSMVRKHDKPLQQVVRRYGEQLDHIEVDSNLSLSTKSSLKCSHNQGPLASNCTGQQYKRLLFNNIFIKVDIRADSFIMTNSKLIVKCVNIIQNSLGEIKLIGYSFNKQKPFYNTPIDSSVFDIYIVEDINKTLNCWKLTDIYKKVMLITFNTIEVAIPIFHTLPL
ncbi:Uncharacterized protein FWK35_00016045 [Aphis craccivora]|uniref:DUF4806 domain-containing protein n=1 Tax=Aphis craccivora TaxID=307492 RepID=A0A6G0Y8H3_APHCR|nr:Uncharacterized protein FWK35_00016045 [Aphis craccivora]